MKNKDRIVLYYSELSDKFYVGERKKGSNNTVNDNVDVTSDFLRCITQWLDNQKTTIITDTGKKFEVTCKKVIGGNKNGKRKSNITRK